MFSLMLFVTIQYITGGSWAKYFALAPIESSELASLSINAGTSCVPLISNCIGLM
jgi:hypothetical protein